LLQIAWLQYHGCPLQCAEGTSIACSKVQLGPLYTRRQGQCSIQIQHSYWCKSWIQPQGLYTIYTRSEGWNRQKLFNLAQVLINAELYGVVFAPKGQKKIPSHLGGQFATQKMLKVGPKLFFDPDSKYKGDLIFKVSTNVPEITRGGEE
jgi:hypothetical protein